MAGNSEVVWPKSFNFFFFWLNQKVVITENLSEIIEK